MGDILTRMDEKATPRLRLIRKRPIQIPDRTQIARCILSLRRPEILLADRVAHVIAG